jgi:hypothetical protein
MMAMLRRVVTPALALALVLPTATAVAAPLDNDDFLSAQRLAFFERDATADRTNVGAGIEADEPLTANETPVEHGCGTTAPSQLSHTIWYEIVGDGGPVTVHTRGSEVDTVVVVYDTDASPASPDPSADDGTSNFIGCNDDISDSDRDSEVTFDTAPDVGYLVQVGGCAGCGLAEEGSVEFIAYNEPSNNARAQAVELRHGAAPTEDDNFGATLETGERAACGSVPFGRTIWYRFRAPGSGTAVFTTSGIDTVLSVYRGSTFLTCNDDGPGQSTASRIQLGVTAGDYFVQVGGIGVGRDADYGSINAQVAFTPTVVPPRDGDGDGVPDSADRCPGQNAAARDANRDGCLDPDLDPDRDGVPVPADKCPTQNAAGRDVNRDGCLDPVPRKRISADASLRATPTGNGIRVRWLRVKAPKGTKVTVRCGARCRFVKRASASSKPLAVAAKTVTVKKLAGRSFRAGQKIRIYVTRKNRIGAYIQYTVKRGGFKRVNRCLNPGSMKPRKRCR